jgi:hypothetical protein
MSELDLPGEGAATDNAELLPPDMPVIDPATLTKYPKLLADVGNMRYGVAWQRWTGFQDGACFALTKLSDFSGIKVVERFPLTEQGWAETWAALVARDRGSAQVILRVLAERAALSQAVSGTILKKAPRFPSSAATRRQILDAIATGNEKYARPFDKGSVALASVMGTQSWADYGNVVLQMALLDTMLSIEEKLGALLSGPGAAETAQTDETPSARQDGLPS